MTHTYFLPFYFQSAKGISAESSGLSLIPYLASLMIASFAAGGALMAVGICLPFMWFGSVVFAVASGLLTTLEVDSPPRVWIGYQILAGVGYSSTLSIAAVCIQASLDPLDLPTGNAMMLFSTFLGGAVAVSVAQAVFVNVLEQQLRQSLSQVEVAAVISAGAAALSSAVPPDVLGTVVNAYNFAISRVFLLPVAGAGLALVATFGIKWQNIKTMNSKQD